MAGVQWNTKILQALTDIARKPTGRGLCLIYAQHLSALQRQPAGHDEPDVTGTKDHAAPGGHLPHPVNVMLGRTCGEHTRRTGTMYGHLPGCALAAACGEHQRPGLHLPQPFPAHQREHKAFPAFFDAGNESQQRGLRAAAA